MVAHRQRGGEQAEHEERLCAGLVLDVVLDRVHKEGGRLRGRIKRKSGVDGSVIVIDRRLVVDALER